MTKDLIDLRESTGKSQRQFEADAGLPRGTVNRIETGQDTIDVSHLDIWLNAAGTTMLKYLNQLQIADALRALQDDWKLAELFTRALKNPAKQKILKSFLEGLFDGDDKPRDKNQKSRRA